MATDLNGKTGAGAFFKLTINAAWSAQFALDRGAGKYDDGKGAAEAWTFAAGTPAVTQANQLFTDIRTLANAANEDLDLTTLTNFRGQVLGFGKLLALWIHNRSNEASTTPAHTAGDSSIKVKPAAANGCLIFDDPSDIKTLLYGGHLIMADPDAAGITVDGTHKLINVAQSGGTSTPGCCYEIIALGAVAA